MAPIPWPMPKCGRLIPRWSKLVGEDGTVGWGETCPVGSTYAEAHAGGARAALSEMAEGLIGADLWPVTLNRKMKQSAQWA